MSLQTTSNTDLANRNLSGSGLDNLNVNNIVVDSIDLNNYNLLDLNNYSLASYDLQSASMESLGLLSAGTGNPRARSNIGGIEGGTGSGMNSKTKNNAGNNNTRNNAAPSINNQHQVRYTALYLRLSNDDRNSDESDSIENQRDLLTLYANDNGFDNLMEFVDDGWSGIDFQKRPSFKRMMAMVEAGQIGTVIVKDLSRLGRERNYMGIFMEYVFPKFGVRFIALGDSVDSDKGDNDIIPFLNLFNEYHAKSTSKKVRDIKDLGARQGKRVNGSTPYGYRWDKEQGKLLIDEIAAPIVKRIFDLCVGGMSLQRIANTLTAEDAPTYTIHFGHKPAHPETAPEIWSAVSIAGILKNKVYLGHVITKRTYSISYKQRKQIHNKEEDMLIFHDMHEPIIDEETFAIVQNIRQNRRRQTKNQEQPIFSGLLFCSCCGRNHFLYRGAHKDPAKYSYNCGNYRAKGRDCTPHSIRVGDLERIITEHLKAVIHHVEIDQKGFAEKLMDKSQKSYRSDIGKKKHELEKAAKRINELDTLITKLFEQHALGNLSEGRFLKMTQDYEQEQQTLAITINTLESDISQSTNTLSSIGKFIKIVKKHTNLEELTAATLRELIQKIVVHEKERVPAIGSRGREIKVIRQKVDIHYNFIGVVE